MFEPALREALANVQKPGRYTGGEPGCVYKDKETGGPAVCLLFPRHL